MCPKLLGKGDLMEVKYDKIEISLPTAKYMLRKMGMKLEDAKRLGALMHRVVQDAIERERKNEQEMEKE